MGMQKPNMGLNFSPHIWITWYRACKTPKLPWSIGIQPKMPLPDTAHISKLQNTSRWKFRTILDHENVFFGAILRCHNKFKMADDRHFQNHRITISLQKIIRFWWNLAHISRLWMRRQPHDQKLKILNSRWRIATILKIVFCHNPTADCPIWLKFCMGKQYSMVMEITHSLTHSLLRLTSWGS